MDGVETDRVPDVRMQCDSIIAAGHLQRKHSGSEQANMRQEASEKGLSREGTDATSIGHIPYEKKQ